MIELKKGVRLHVITTKKYKTIQVYGRFTTRLTKEIMTKRALLANLLETNSLYYPDQTKLSGRLAELYGASFGLNVGRKGNLHWLDVGLGVVNGKYVDDPKLLSEAVDFLQEVLFYPNIHNGKFDEQTFQLEKENLQSYIETLQEDKQTLASLKIKETYFTDEAQKLPSFGTVADLANETSESLAAYYHTMITQDQVDLFVIGDVEEKEVAELFQQLPFAEREEDFPAIYYYQTKDNVIREQQVQEAVVQGKLNLAYATDVYYEDSDRFALLVFNGLFGGFPHSKLFMNVREKASLAYYASSSFDTFRGYLQVQTGINSANREKVLHLINEQLIELQAGDFTELAFQQTKAMLKNHYLLGLDSMQNTIETTYLAQWLPKSKLTDEEWLRRLAAVTPEDVQHVAKKIRLQAIFFLDGGQ
ncbi:pitrilysin family protein [Enterococcus dongliensis]|uniref:Pitrilysin family protein n=1 Tax=Enterococcus dongliensis TaxID=2559925 RepID=A0AAP5NJ24_9ENTE|nr:pitrilysin family protein [Enterococcus dongliensis]MDT2597606.1 pitrilysin family protein [Enterococcus dongliensis]MDT2603701.1 pitrilysin family protein [Enterococcus dongliensis]MDT2634144.1 pitrilysin family protein [Enterococcus dongliensis]MDT2637074.1 pitrilysin family protein [Enterococcus dongliensis]MDT2642359.1 pitrilysin family protein [Enterococcus dongliensis]